MRKKIINRMQSMLPNKVLRRQQFAKRAKNKQRHTQRYQLYSYKHNGKASRFNRWQDYKRISNQL